MGVRSIMFATLLAAFSLNASSLPGQETGKTVYIQAESLVVAKVKGTNRFLAYSKTVGKWNGFSFPEGVKAIPVVGNSVCAFQLEGEKITEIVAVDRNGNWCRSKLPVATRKCVPIVSNDIAVCVIDGRAHAFSAELGTWDAVASLATPQVSRDMAMIVTADSIAAFSAATGKWAVARTTK